MSVIGLLNNSCTIRRTTTGKSTMGAASVTWSDTTGVACAVQVKKGVQQGYPVQAGDTEYDVYFPLCTDVRVSDLLVTISNLTDYTLAVTSEAEDESGRGAYTRVTAKHLTGGGVK